MWVGVGRQPWGIGRGFSAGEAVSDLSSSRFESMPKSRRFMRAAIAISFSHCSARPSQTLSLRPGAAFSCGSVQCGNRKRSRALTEREAFLCFVQSSASRGPRTQSAHQPAEDIFRAGPKRDYRLNIRRGARAQGACDLDCGARLTALTERDGVRATLVGARLASRAFRAIERRRCGGFPRLSAQLRVSDASFCHEFDER